MKIGQNFALNTDFSLDQSMSTSQSWECCQTQSILEILLSLNHCKSQLARWTTKWYYLSNPPGHPQPTCCILLHLIISALLEQNWTLTQEVRMLVNMVSTDPRSNTCKNLRYFREKTGLEQPNCYSSWKIKSSLPVQKVPADQMRRLGLMLMELKQKKYTEVKDNQRITAMLDSLCST